MAPRNSYDAGVLLMLFGHQSFAGHHRAVVKKINPMPAKSSTQ